MKSPGYKETIIISMGGSLLIPDEIDTHFLSRMKDLLRHFTSEGYQIILVIGGGKVCRRYQAAAQQFPHISHNDLDWIGIKTIHLNCELVLRVFSDLNVHPKIIIEPESISEVLAPIAVVGAWQPGHSSDTDAVDIAEKLGSSRIINFSNTSYVYDGDPQENPDAQKFSEMTWDQYRRVIPQKWSPGLSSPFDPIASERCQMLGITVAVLGASLENLDAYLHGSDFQGTIIQ